MVDMMNPKSTFPDYTCIVSLATPRLLHPSLNNRGGFVRQLLIFVSQKCTECCMGRGQMHIISKLSRTVLEGRGGLPPELIHHVQEVLDMA